MKTWTITILWLLVCAALWLALDLPGHRVNTGEATSEQRD